MMDRNQLTHHNSGSEYDFSALIPPLKNEFGQSDYIIANLETPVAGEKLQYTQDLYSFNSPAGILSALREIGVDMVQTANNHCLDRGVEGLKKTIQNVEEAGLAYIGTHMQEEDSFRILDLNGVKVGILAFTYGTNAFANKCYLNENDSFYVDLLQKQELSGFFERQLYLSKHKPLRAIKKLLGILCPGRFNAPIYERREPSRFERKRLKEQLQKCRNAGAEFVIMLLHIGGQYNSGPSAYTKEMCAYCIECGADLVVANHEHVIHSYDSGTANTSGLCWYSLGNFLSSLGVLQEPFDKLSQYSVVVHADIDRSCAGVHADYFFQLFICHQNSAGTVVTEPVINFINGCNDAGKRAQVRAECSLLLNRIYKTTDIDYDICEYYQVLQEPDAS